MEYVGKALGIDLFLECNPEATEVTIIRCKFGQMTRETVSMEKYLAYLSQQVLLSKGFVLGDIDEKQC